jgi:hypothetical protein
MLWQLAPGTHFFTEEERAQLRSLRKDLERGQGIQHLENLHRNLRRRAIETGSNLDLEVKRECSGKEEVIKQRKESD